MLEGGKKWGQVAFCRKCSWSREEAQIQCKECAKEAHTSWSADEAEKKGIPSVELQVPFLTTWVALSHLTNQIGQETHQVD